MWCECDDAVDIIYYFFQLRIRNSETCANTKTVQLGNFCLLNVKQYIVINTLHNDQNKHMQFGWFFIWLKTNTNNVNGFRNTTILAHDYPISHIMIVDTGWVSMHNVRTNEAKWNKV